MITLDPKDRVDALVIDFIRNRQIQGNLSFTTFFPGGRYIPTEPFIRRVKQKLGLTVTVESRMVTFFVRQPPEDLWTVTIQR